MMQFFTPIEYLKIDIANNFGADLDKADWDDRLAWFDANEADLDQLQKRAESPALFFAGVQAYRKAKAGKPIGYPISLDATASGAQLLALMVGCRKSGRMCNVVDTGHREDFYTNVFRAMQNRLPMPNIERRDAKNATMTALYGSTREPENVLGKDTPELTCFYETMAEDCEGIWQLNNDLLQLWDSTKLENSWTLPDNFHVVCRVTDLEFMPFIFNNVKEAAARKINAPKEFEKSLGANATHSVDGFVFRELGRRCDYDIDQYANVLHMLLNGMYVPAHLVAGDRPQDKTLWAIAKHWSDTGILSARVIELLDEHNMGLIEPMLPDLLALMKSMPKKPFHVLGVHDCFRVHPNYGNDLRRQYNQILSEIADSTLIDKIVSDIAGVKVNVRKYGNLANDVRNANYALS